MGNAHELSTVAYAGSRTRLVLVGWIGRSLPTRPRKSLALDYFFSFC
jgi:hypothetical protein